ncbi:MAG: CPBP family intramembrane glutamic endopeptidase [Mobilitalea sp.]
MNNVKNGIEFNEKIEGKRAVIGVITCIMYCFGITFLTNSISGNSGILTFVTWILSFVLCGKAVIVGLKKQSPIKIIAWSLLAAVLCFIFQNIIFKSIIEPMAIQILGLANFSSSNTTSFIENIQNGGKAYVIFMLFGGIILGPIIEELLYRVCFFTVLRKKSYILAHIATALMFGLQHVFTAIIYEGHPQEILIIGGYMSFSLVLTIMYEKTKTPVPGILAHMLLNGGGLTYMLLG